MLPETDRSNLAYDLSMYDNAARREQEREQERERERRARQIKMNMHSVSRSGSKLKLFAVTAVALGALWAVNVQFTKVDDIARKVEDQRALLAEAQEENSLLQSRLDSKANISYIEEYAANELGMAKVTNSQINYLDVNTENLIEVTPENNGSIFSADALMKGAADARAAYADCDLQKNDCYKYAALRNILYRKGKSVEMLIAYEPSFAMMNEWYKQLFGESEGKDNKGIYPSSAVFSTDLHSLGQFIQDGSRVMFETVMQFAKPQKEFFLKDDPTNVDGLNFLSNQNMSVVNRKAYEGTVIAHTEGGVPNIVLEAPELNEYELGYIIYFFEKACAISGYLLGVNPFNQPGVESYKKNMFALLGKPGYEAQKAELEAKLGL